MTGKRGLGESKTSQRMLTAAEREHEAFQMRKAGATYQAIAEELGVSRAAAYKAVQRALAKLPPLPELAEFRKLELERLDSMHASLWPKRDDPETSRVLVRIMERRTKLVGGDVLPALNAVGLDAVQGVFDAIVGMAVRMLAADVRPAFLAEVERQMLQIEAPRDAS